MVVGLKDGVKLVGIAIIACAAVFVTTLFLNYLIDVTATRALIDDADAAAVALYNAQLSTAKFSSAISGAGLTAIAVAALAFYIKLYVDKSSRNLGILKAMGYSDREIAMRFWVFGVPVLVGAAVGFGLAFACMPAVYESLTGGILPDVPIRFHAALPVCLIVAPTVVFSAVSCLFAVRALKRPVMEMIKGGKKNAVKFRPERKGRKEHSFVYDMVFATLKSRISLAVFVALAGFCFSAMTQMSLSMLDLNAGDLAYIILVIGVVVACTVFVMAVTSLIKSNEKNVSLMKACGYGFRECTTAVLGGYRPIAYIGFAVGTLYQFGLMSIMMELIYKDIEGLGEYSFNVAVFFIVLAIFAVLYEAATLVFAYRLGKSSVKEVMLET